MKEISPTNSTLTIKVDDEDYPLLSRFNWYVSDGGYAMTQIRGSKHLRMHHLVWGANVPTKLVLDHINRDKLDNRKENLRCVTQAVNVRNSEQVENAKGYYYSYSKCRKHNKWVVDYQGINNTFLTEEEAKKAVEEIKAGTFVKNKEKWHDYCKKCGHKKIFYGGAFTCRDCALKRSKDYYQRKKGGKK